MLSRPSTLAGLIRQSAALRSISRIGGYRSGPWHSRIILPEQYTFRAFTVELSRIAAFNFRREPAACTSQFLPHQHWPSGRRGKPLALQNPATNSTLEGISAISPFALATALLVVSLLGWSVGLAPPLSRLLPGFQPSGSPLSAAGYNYGATLGFAPADLHPQVQQLASLHPSGRALARAPRRWRVSSPALSVARWVHNSTIGHVSSAPLRCRTSGFPTVRLKAQVPLSSRLPFPVR